MSQVFNPAFFFAWACGVGGKPFTEVKITPKGEKAIGPGLDYKRKRKPKTKKGGI